MITLKLFAGLRDLVGKKEVQIEKEAANLKEVLDDLAAQNDAKINDYLFDTEGNILQSILLLVNDQPIDKEPDVPLKSGDVLSILLPTAGG